MLTSMLPRSRLSQLRGALSSSVAALHRRNAAEIPAGYIEDYVSLSWLEWDGGHLRLTIVGTNILQQLDLELGGAVRPESRPALSSRQKKEPGAPAPGSNPSWRMEETIGTQHT